MSKFIGVIVGAIEIAVGVVVTVLSGGTLAPLGFMLIAAGAGTFLSGVGTLIAGSGSSNGQQSGFVAASRNPVAPWNIIYGRTVIGGTIVFINSFNSNQGDNSDEWLDVVIVLAAHSIQSVDALLFDKQIVQLGTNGGTFDMIGDSFTPLQQTVNIHHISRAVDASGNGGVVTVVLLVNIPLLVPGDMVEISGITGDYTLNGKWQVAQIVSQVFGSPGSITFTYISGGLPSIVDLEGAVTTLWPDYGRKIHMEVLLGTQTSTFQGMLSGTAFDGDTSNLVLNPNNPWTATHVLRGKACVFLRLHYSSTVFSGGLPSISFLVHGKNDIYDPRGAGTAWSNVTAYGIGNVVNYSGSTYTAIQPNTNQQPNISPSYWQIGCYTENAALCIADFLANQTWGFKAAYGAEIPTTPLTAAANVCDEAVSLAAGGTEPRYALNGKFDLSTKRGEILQNLLTACAGRLTYTGGQFVIWPAVWYGSSPGTSPGMGAMSGPFTWKPTVAIRDLYNGVKGTYISPSNKWQASDLPAYAVDTNHGYSNAALWVNTTAYALDAIVSWPAGNPTKSYIALGSTTGNQPDISPTHWAPIYQDEYVIQDGGDRRWLDMQLPFTISAATAQRIAKIELLRRRHQGTGTFRFNMAGYAITVMDVIQMTVPYLGWSSKLLEVLASRFTLQTQNQGGVDVTVLGTEIDVQETDASVYDWSTFEELTPQGFQQAAIPSQFAPAPPTDLLLVSDADTVVTGAGGIITDSIVATWIPPADGFVQQGGWIEIQYQGQLTESEGTIAVTNGSANVTGTGTNFLDEMTGGTLLIGGVPYVVKSVTDVTHLVLATVFAGTTASGLLFALNYTGPWVALPSVDPSVTQAQILGVVDDDFYNVQIRSVNAGGVPSNWVEAGPIRASGIHAPLPWRPRWQGIFYTPSTGLGVSLAQHGSTVDISGYNVINQLSPTLTAPITDPYAVVTSDLSANMTVGAWVAQVFAIDSNGLRSPGSGLTQFSISASTSKATFNASFPAGTINYEIFFGPDRDHLYSLVPLGRGQWNSATGYAPGDVVSYGGILYLSILAGTNHQPDISPTYWSLFTTIEVTGMGPYLTLGRIGLPAGYGPPDVQSAKYHVLGAIETHGGIFVANVLAASSDGPPETTLTVKIFTPTPLTTDELAGRYLSVVSKAGLPGGTQYLWDLQILHNDTSGNLTIPNTDTAKSVNPGDLVLMRTLGTAFTSTTAQDTGWVNPFAPSGLTVDQDKGKILMIVNDPTGSARAGDAVTVISNTSDTHTTTPFPRVPGTGSVYVILDPAELVDVATKPFVNTIVPGVGTPPVVATVDVSALAGNIALFQIRTQDQYGNDSISDPDGFREIYVQPIPPDAGESPVAVTAISTTLSATITANDAAMSLASLGGLPSGPFLATIGSECIYCASGNSNPIAITRGWNGTAAAAHSSGAAATVNLAQPDLVSGNGKMQALPMAAHTTVLAPIPAGGPTTFVIDFQQNSTGGWAALFSTGYSGLQASSQVGTGYDQTPSTHTYQTCSQRSSGPITLDAQTGGVNFPI